MLRARILSRACLSQLTASLAIIWNHVIVFNWQFLQSLEIKNNLFQFFKVHWERLPHFIFSFSPPAVLATPLSTHTSPHTSGKVENSTRNRKYLIWDSMGSSCIPSQPSENCHFSGGIAFYIAWTLCTSSFWQVFIARANMASSWLDGFETI